MTASPRLPFVAAACLALLPAACKQETPAPAPKSAAELAVIEREVESASMRAWLARMLTCGDRDFLRADAALQRKQLMKVPGLSCELGSNGAPMRCSIAPPLHLAQADIDWFVIGPPQDALATIILPAPPESVRASISAGSGAVTPGTDLGDTTVQCALTDEALTPGAIAGTVKRDGDPSASVRVCAFELADGVPTCTRTERGKRDYRIENLVRGDYLVLAVPGDAPDGRVGYTDCEGAADTPCTHELKVVVVEAGRTTEGIDPADLRTMQDAGDWPQPPPPAER